MLDCLKSIYVNGKRMKGFKLDGDFTVPFFNTNIETQQVKGRKREAFISKEITGTKVTLPMLYYFSDRDMGKNELMNDIVEYIDHDEEVEVEIEGEDWFWRGYFTGEMNINYFDITYARFDLELQLLDPARFSKKLMKNTAYQDVVTAVNNGTQETGFTMEATALENSPFFFFGNEDNHILVGDDNEEKKLNNYSPTLLTNEFRDQLGFSRMGASESIPDRYLGGTTGASFVQNPETWGLNLDNVQQKSGWRGGALSRTFNRSAQNFRTTVKINVRQTSLGSGKAGQFIYDERNRLMFSLGYQNVHSTKDSGRILFMAYNEAGDERMLWGPKINNKLKRAKVLTIYLRLERKGDKLNMSYWTYDDTNDKGRNKNTLLQPVANRTFTDGGKFYQRKVTNTRFGIFRGNGKFRDLRLLGVYFYELLDKPKNARDYLIKQGDIITIDTTKTDTRKNVVSINGIPVTHTFSSSFFKIPKGMTNYTTLPENTFDTAIWWRDKYK